MSSGIVFQVETKRVLQILAREIYDSPLALIRENVQNAYDAVRMRFAASGTLAEGGRIDVRVQNDEISITDNGVGMTETVLRENFWKAGSSGKHSDTARKAGVVGTFGIGAMANFGVCTRLTVETKTEGSSEWLRSVADRDSLKIAEECISLERLSTPRDVGTTVTAKLETPISVDQARQYLEPYIGILQLPVYLNDQLISQKSVDSKLPIAGRQFTQLGTQSLKDGLCSATFDVRADSNGQIVVYVTNITLAGNAVEGSMALVQSGGQLMGLRSNFGLAPIPAIGMYQFGGIANLSFLHPTAGREALSRESIEQTTHLVNLAELAASQLIAESPLADKNNAFLQWITTRGQYALAKNVAVRALPEDADVPMGNVKQYIGTRSVHYYGGTDQHILKTFANAGSCCFRWSKGNLAAAYKSTISSRSSRLRKFLTKFS